MNADGKSPLPAVPGDSDGLHGAAYAPDECGAEQSESLGVTVSGEVIRFMWDYGVQVPLWHDEGLLPEEPAWLRQVLGLSDQLIVDMMAWCDDMGGVDAEPSTRTEGAWAELDRRGRLLADRLQRELGSRYAVQYRPW